MQGSYLTLLLLIAQDVVLGLYRTGSVMNIIIVLSALPGPNQMPADDIADHLTDRGTPRPCELLLQRNNLSTSFARNAKILCH